MKLFNKLAIAAVSLVLGFSGFQGQANAATISWTDWTTGDYSDGFIGEGTITTPSSTIGVTYSNPQGIAFYQPSGGRDYWANNWNGSRDAATSAYTSDFVENIPTANEMIALRYAGNQTLTFSETVANPVFSYVSLNGNGYAFDQDFEILSFGDASNGNDCGVWGCGTSYKEVVDLGNGKFEYRLLGTGEPHGTIKFAGAFDTVSWRSLSTENWNGFTVGVEGTKADVFQSVPEPASMLGVLAVAAFGSASTLKRKKKQKA